MIYLISGLGADERVFQKLNFGKHATTYLPWIIPEENETMQDYLRRFSGQINKEEEVILIGVSFGGLIAIELSKMIEVKKIILISSIKTHNEFSLLLKFLKLTKIYKLFPATRFKKRFRFLSHYYFGSKTPEERKSLNELIDDSDTRIMDWSVLTFFNWKNEQAPENLYHIHGTHDKIFPSRYLRNTIPVKQATHFMIANRAEEVSEIIQYILDKN